jgi:hypothetical protein
MNKSPFWASIASMAVHTSYFRIHHFLRRLVLLRRVHVIKNAGWKSGALQHFPGQNFAADRRKEPRDLVFAGLEAGADRSERAPPIDRVDRIDAAVRCFRDRNVGAGAQCAPAKITKKLPVDERQVATQAKIVLGLRFPQSGVNPAQRTSLGELIAPARQIAQRPGQSSQRHVSRPAHYKHFAEYRPKQSDPALEHRRTAKNEQGFGSAQPAARPARQHKTGDRRQSARHSNILRRMMNGE